MRAVATFLAHAYALLLLLGIELMVPRLTVAVSAFIALSLRVLRLLLCCSLHLFELASHRAQLILEVLVIWFLECGLAGVAASSNG